MCVCCYSLVNYFGYFGWPTSVSLTVQYNYCGGCYLSQAWVYNAVGVLTEKKFHAHELDLCVNCLSYVMAEILYWANILPHFEVRILFHSNLGMLRH